MFHHGIQYDYSGLEYSIYSKGKLIGKRLLEEDALKLFAKGSAFITYNYGIDGVSIEISKYAQILNDLYAPFGEAPIYLIGGKFFRQSKSVLSAEWQTLQLDGIDGWDKIERGKIRMAVIAAILALGQFQVLGRQILIGDQAKQVADDIQTGVALHIGVDEIPGRVGRAGIE